MCKVNVEDGNYIISADPDISARYYLPLGHDAISKVVFKAHVMKKNDEVKFKLQSEPGFCFFKCS